MPASEKNDNQASPDEFLTSHVHRRSILKFFAGAFAAAALPEALEACGSGTAEEVGILGSAVGITSGMTWVTRKQDGLSLGFQFVNLVADANHNVAIATQGTPAYVAITFPPQHVIEDAFNTSSNPYPPVGSPTPPNPISARASGTSRIVFEVPSTYGTPVDAGGVGTFPYNLQGVLELCAVSQPVVAPNAGMGAPSPSAQAEDEEIAPKYRSLSHARIDRVIARVDPKAAERVRRRARRAGRMLKRDPKPATSPATTSGTGTPVMPTSGQTSIELPFRLLISPNAQAGWSFMSAPVESPNAQSSPADSQRYELWHARLVPLNGAGLPAPGQAPLNTAVGVPSPEALTMRALYARDWDIYGGSNPYGVYNPADGGVATPTSANDPVDLANPWPAAREGLVLQSGDGSNPSLPPLNVDTLVLSPLGGTLEAWADFDSTVSAIANVLHWKQQTVLGRDDYVNTVTLVTVEPGGFPGILTTVNKRCENPLEGTVGVIYSTTYLTITTPTVSFVDLPNESHYLTFPFVALEVTQTKLLVNQKTQSGVVFPLTDPSLNPIVVGMIGTDWKGNAIKFTTQLLVAPRNSLTGQNYALQAMNAWNGSGTGQPIVFNGQRIAYAPPADGLGPGASPNNYSADSTSFETSQFNITLTNPTGNTAPAALVPVAKSLQIAVEAVRHLQSSPFGGTPSASAIYDYDAVCYAKNGFAMTTPPTPAPASFIASPTAGNPNEVFLTLTTASAGTPNINFAPNTAASGGLAGPAMAANALSRSTGIVSGSTSSPSNAIFTGGLNPSDFFSGFNPVLFGCVPLGAIIPELTGLASQFLPKAVTKELSNAEQFLEEAMGLYSVLSNLTSTSSGGQSSLLTTILNQVGEDISTYAQLAQGTVPPGGTIAGGTSYVAEGAPLTNAQTQEAAWMQSAAAEAQTLLQQYQTSLVQIAGDAVTIYNDITNLTFELLFENPSNPKGTGDLTVLLTALANFIAPIEALVSAGSDDAGAPPGPDTAAGAVMSYFGPVLRPIQSALASVSSFLEGASSAVSQLQTDLAALQQGLDLAKDMSVEFDWKPVISGVNCSNFVAFIPSSNQALSFDIQIDATASNGHPAGANITIRLDSFAIAFGGTLPGLAPQASPWPGGAFAGTFLPTLCGYKQTLQNADVSLVFDHMQVQMLAGQKPDVDIVFNDIYFGGDLAFVETFKNLIPVDAFSDPPFLNVTTSGITAGLNLGLPNVAIGMFSIQNLNISASLTIPFVSTSGVNGLTFEFDFCSIENPFVVTVSMLGGGGFFSMWMDMQGIERIALGVQVEAQLSADFVVASGSISIEVGIFLVYWSSQDVNTSAKDPVTGQNEVAGWLIGGYLRLRGELDVCGVITISVELYLQITYSPTTGKCIASGFISVDVSLFFFSVHAQIPFSRQFSGANGDPTMAEMMSAGGVDPMFDPTLASTAAADMWDPFAEYCLAYT